MFLATKTQALAKAKAPLRAANDDGDSENLKNAKQFYDLHCQHTETNAPVVTKLNTGS